MHMKTCLLFAALLAMASAQFAPAPLTPDSVVATVDGKKVTVADIQAILQSSPPGFVQGFQKDPMTALSTYFGLKHMAAEGDKLKLAEQSPLKEQIEFFRANAVAGAMINRERDSYHVDSTMIDAYFERHRSNYEQARIKLIQIAFKPAPAAPTGTSPDDLKRAAEEAFGAANARSSRTEAQAKTLAADIVRQIRAGADFVKMVEQYSDDPGTKSNSGDYGVIKPDSSLPEDFRKKVFALKSGEVSDPLGMGTDLYIVRVEEKIMPAIADVREQIIQNIRQEHLGEYINSLNSRFRPTVVNPEFFARPEAILGPQARQ